MAYLNQFLEVDIDPRSPKLSREFGMPISGQRLVQYATKVRWQLDTLLMKSDNSAPTEFTKEEAKFEYNILAGTWIKRCRSSCAPYIVRC